MNVASILKAKGRDVFTIQPHRTLEEAAHALAEKGIGAVVVCGADGEALGILSERDIVRALARESVKALAAPVSRFMTTNLVTTHPLASVDRLMQQMTTHRFRHMPVIENGRLSGLVSIGDVVKWHVEEIDNDREAMRDYIAHA
jgi:CBS domain-containing protein